ncbi:MAG: winged helix-turn-helix transcriptional regulator [Thermoplasmata archaeon]|nr:winged helix-turn-helix transcriptional regulator [Thermoplasmata archaeon]
MKRLLYWLLSTSGGVNRGRIIELLREKPMNAHEISDALKLDYKTVRHHLRVLEKNNLVTSAGGYGKMYFISEMLEANMEYFDEIWDEIGKNKINKRRMR